MQHQYIFIYKFRREKKVDYMYTKTRNTINTQFSVKVIERAQFRLKQTEKEAYYVLELGRLTVELCSFFSLEKGRQINRRVKV